MVEAEFIKFCKKKLAMHIGPIAQMLCKKTLAKNPNLTRTEFVEILAKKIPDPNQALEFKTEMLEWEINSSLYISLRSTAID